MLHQWSAVIGWARIAGDAVGYFLFTYSLALVLRAAVRIFRLSRWYNMYLTTVQPAKGLQAKAPASAGAEQMH